MPPPNEIGLDRAVDCEAQERIQHGGLEDDESRRRGPRAQADDFRARSSS
jgi:hypothetical protein